MQKPCYGLFERNVKPCSEVCCCCFIRLLLIVFARTIINLYLGILFSKCTTSLLIFVFLPLKKEKKKHQSLPLVSGHYAALSRSTETHFSGKMIKLLFSLGRYLIVMTQLQTPPLASVSTIRLYAICLKCELQA